MLLIKLMQFAFPVIRNFCHVPSFLLHCGVL